MRPKPQATCTARPVDSLTYITPGEICVAVLCEKQTCVFASGREFLMDLWSLLVFGCGLRRRHRRHGKKLPSGPSGLDLHHREQTLFRIAWMRDVLSFNVDRSLIRDVSLYQQRCSGTRRASLVSMLSYCCVLVLVRLCTARAWALDRQAAVYLHHSSIHHGMYCVCCCVTAVLLYRYIGWRARVWDFDCRRCVLAYCCTVRTDL